MSRPNSAGERMGSDCEVEEGETACLGVASGFSLPWFCGGDSAPSGESVRPRGQPPLPHPTEEALLSSV